MEYKTCSQTSTQAQAHPTYTHYTFANLDCSTEYSHQNFINAMYTRVMSKKKIITHAHYIYTIRHESQYVFVGHEYDKLDLNEEIDEG
jgi:hypothetical protein